MTDLRALEVAPPPTAPTPRLAAWPPVAADRRRGLADRRGRLHADARARDRVDLRDRQRPSRQPRPPWPRAVRCPRRRPSSPACSTPVPGRSLPWRALPDWSDLAPLVEGAPLDPAIGADPRHRRTLDMRQGMIWRDWRHAGPSRPHHPLPGVPPGLGVRPPAAAAIGGADAPRTTPATSASRPRSTGRPRSTPAAAASRSSAPPPSERRDAGPAGDSRCASPT